MKERNYMRAYVINYNGSSNNLPCYPTDNKLRQSLISECCLLEDGGEGEAATTSNTRGQNQLQHNIWEGADFVT